MNIQTASPSEIDQALADLYVKAAAIEARRARLISILGHIVGLRPRGARSPAFLDSRPVAFDFEIVKEAERHLTVSRTERHLVDYAEASGALSGNALAQQPLHAEFDRRGGWTRAFLVRNNGGHIHKSMECSTCYDTTSFGWLPQVSGHDEAEIVEAAGEGACSVCYPSAPVEGLSRPRTLLHKDEIAEQAARDEKARIKAEKAAAKAAKALLEPVSPEGYSFGKIETILAAKSYLTDWYTWNAFSLREEGHPSYIPKGRTQVAEALAAKTGESIEDILAAAQKRAAKRR